MVWPTSVSALVSYPVYRMIERMTENDHITSALLAVVIVIIICYRPSDRVKMTDRTYLISKIQNV